MNKYIMSILTASFLVLINASAAVAGDFAGEYDYILPETFVNVYWVDRNLALGLKQDIWHRIYATGNIEFASAETDLLLQVGAVHVLPREVVFLRINGEKVISFNLYFYGGGGLQFSRNEGYNYSYLLLGFNYLFLFSESVYPLSEVKGPQYRWGFSFRF